MKAKDKAIELRDNYYALEEDETGFTTMSPYQAKLCALIAVREIQKTRPGFPYPFEVGKEIIGIVNNINFPLSFWKEVESELIKL